MGHATLDDALAATARRVGGRLVASWIYPNGAVTARFALGDGAKTFRPFCKRDGDGWMEGDPPGLWPLYGAKRLDRFPSEPGFLAEGEAKANCLSAVGLIGLASAHGANGAAKTDWRPLAGRELFILPDNDVSGRRYADAVAALVTALDPPGRVRLLVLPDLPVKGDIVDWVGADGLMGAKTPDEIRAAIFKLAAAAPPWTAEAVDEVATTDLGNAERFARTAGGKARFVGGWGRWIVYRGGRWARDDSFAVLQLAGQTARGVYDEAKAAPDRTRQRELADHARRSQSRDRLSAMVDLARPALAVAVEELDADPFALNVRNGVLDLRSGELRPHRPADLATHRAAVRYDKDATCPRFLAFVSEIMNGHAGLVAYMQRLVGLCLTGDVSEQAMWVFHGDGANGKTTFQEAICGLLGDYAAEAPPDLLLVRRNAEHPCEVADLCGRRLVVASEADEGRRLRVQLVKRLTGNVRLKARFMRGDYFEFGRTHKLILATNSRPVIREATLAIWRRIRLVPFSVTIPPEHQDSHLPEKLREERSGILNWAIKGCLDWQEGGLDEPPEVLAATEDYRVGEDQAAEFWEDCCVFGPGIETSRADLYMSYTRWAAEIGDRQPLGRRALYDRVRRRRDVDEATRRIGGRVTRLFVGIGVRAPEPIGQGS